MSISGASQERRRYTREEIRRSIPHLQALTDRAEQDIERMLSSLDGVEPKTPGEAAAVGAIDLRVARWFDDVAAVGGVARGLWLVEFAGLAGWLGWQPGARDVIAFRTYGSPPEARSSLH